MGNLFAVCGFSIKQSREASFNKALHLNDTLLQALKELGLEHKHLHALYQIFSAMDRDKSGEINMLEFLDYVDLDRSRFSEKAFSVMDRNCSGEVDFVEFVLAVWNYCSFNHSSLVRFAFDLYDVDGSGEIEHAEVMRCVREVWGSAWETSGTAQKIVDKLDTIMEGTRNNRLSVHLFQEFAGRHPMLLFPAFELQMDIQRKVLGKRFWARATDKRNSMNPAGLNWEHVKEVTMITRQSTSKFRISMEEDVPKKPENNASSATPNRRLGSKVSSSSRNSRRRTFVSAPGNSCVSAPGRSVTTGTDNKGLIDSRSREQTIADLHKQQSPAAQNSNARRQSAPAVSHTSPGIETKVVEVASPKRSIQYQEQILEDME